MLGTKLEVPPFLQKIKACEGMPAGTEEVAAVQVKEPDMTVLQMNENKQIEMSQAERTKLTNTIKAMSPEQLMVVIDAIPVELAFNRIGKELERNKQFRKAITQSMTIIE